MVAVATMTMVETALGLDPNVTADQRRIVSAVLSGGTVTPTEAAKMVGHSVRWIYRRIESGEITPHYRGGKQQFGQAAKGATRIKVSDLKKYL